MNYILILGLVLFISACDQTDKKNAVSERWYSLSQVESGRVIFETNCAVCHKKNAQGRPNWKERLPDGSLPPPPLNGTAHAWHHSLSVLRDYIKGGGAAFGGNMPAFGDKLSASEVDSAIAYFQHFWSDEIYNIWIERKGLE